MGDRLHSTLLALIIAFGALGWWIAVAAATVVAVANVYATYWATRPDADA